MRRAVSEAFQSTCPGAPRVRRSARWNGEERDKSGAAANRLIPTFCAVLLLTG